MRDVIHFFFVSCVYWHSFSGNYMWLGHYWSDGYGAFSSPLISNESNYCSLEFYYRFWRGAYRIVSLSVFIEHSAENTTTLLWSTSEILPYWERKVINLPQTHYNYSVVFLGYFYVVSSVLVDDMEFVRCNLCKLILFSYEALGFRITVCNHNSKFKCCCNLMEIFGKLNPGFTLYFSQADELPVWDG